MSHILNFLRCEIGSICLRLIYLREEITVNHSMTKAIEPLNFMYAVVGVTDITLY